MVLYQCYRCNYTVNNKSNMVRHIARKKRCNNVLSDIELDECKKDILDGISFDEYLNAVSELAPLNKDHDFNSIKIRNVENFINVNEEYINFEKARKYFLISSI